MSATLCVLQDWAFTVHKAFYYSGRQPAKLLALAEVPVLSGPAVDCGGGLLAEGSGRSGPEVACGGV